MKFSTPSPRDTSQKAEIGQNNDRTPQRSDEWIPSRNGGRSHAAEKSPFANADSIVVAVTPGGLPRTVLQLQQRYGNQRTRRLLQQAQPRIQRDRADTHVGAVEQGFRLQDQQGGMGGRPGQWRAPGQGGFSRAMQGAAGEMLEGMLDEGALSDMLLRHVAPDLSGLPAEEARWSAMAAAAKREIDDWTNNFAPGSVRESYQQRYDAAKGQVVTIRQTATELEQKASQFNSFVPQGNSFFVSAGRLSSMQAMVGATDNASLAGALTQGLRDAQEVIERYRTMYEQGNRRLTTETLDVPEADQTVTQAAREMTDASRNLDAKYMGFQTTVLRDEIGTIREQYAGDERRLAEINEVKQFVRNVGRTVDVTMSVVRGAPAAIANVTETARRGHATLNAARNQRAIMAGRRPRFNPTYVTTDSNGAMVVRNMQTGVDRNAVSGETAPIPESGLRLDPDVSELLGTIADFVYASEVREINLRLEQMNVRISAVNAVIDTTTLQQKILEYRNALNEFATKAAALQARVEDRRREYRDFGMQLDRFAQLDEQTRRAGLGVAQGAERYTTIMTMVAGVQETLALGTQSLNAAPSDLPEWWQTVRRRRFGTPTEGEQRSVNLIHGQITRFRRSVSATQDLFASVADRARSVVGNY